LAAVLTRCIARAGRYHATNSPGANLDSFSRPRSGEPQGGGEQLSTVKPGIRQANSLAWRRLNAPSSARGMKAPHSSKRPTLTSGPFCIEAPRGASLPHAAHLPWCALPARPSQGLAFDAEIAPCLRYLRARLNHSAALVALCRPSLACIASRPAFGSPKTHPAFLSPCCIVLRPRCV